MTIVVHTDASTQQGYSCWCYKRCDHDTYFSGIILSANIAAAETLAAVKALRSIPEGERVLIISDCLITVKIIQQQDKSYQYSDTAAKFYKQTRQQLINLLKTREVDAVWVNSKNTNKIHLEVDNTCKTLLADYLNRRH